MAREPRCQEVDHGEVGPGLTLSVGLAVQGNLLDKLDMPGARAWAWWAWRRTSMIERGDLQPAL